MAEDKEILKEVWEGKLPICFKLFIDECNSNDPDGLYLIVPRQSYFFLLKEKIQRYFSEFVNSSIKNNEIWLDFNGIPLKWHYPIGLLYDLYCNSENENSKNLPWCIHVHFEKLPEEELLQFNNKDSFESFFISTIKEADALKHRGKVMNDMQKRDHKQLWYGFQNDKFDQFWSINKKLMETDDSQCFKNIPFRIYQADKHFIQKLYQPVNESGKKQTLNDLLNVICGTNDYEKRLVLIQGIKPPLNTPIQWLSEHLSYPDNFLHICLK